MNARDWNLNLYQEEITINKKRLFILLLALTVILLSACGDGANENEAEEESADKSETEANSDELNNMVKHLKDNGFNIGMESEKAADMIGATQGLAVELDNSIVELYLYDKESSDLEKIKDNGEYSTQGFAIPAVVNGNIVLISHDEHPEKNKVVDAFESY